MEDRETIDGLPVFEVLVTELEEITGVKAISLVEHPAIEVDFYAFSEDEGPLVLNFELSAVHDDQMILAGPIIIADKPMKRKGKPSDYYIKFTKDVVQTMADKFNAEGRLRSLTLMHQGIPVDGYVRANWVTGTNDKSQDHGYKFTLGEAWYGEVKINDRTFWNEEVKTGKVKGFSIEVYGDHRPSKNKQQNMSKQISEALAKLKDGTEVDVSALEVGATVQVMVDGEWAPAPDGKHEMEDGTVLVVKDGLVAEVIAPEVVEAAEVPAADAPADAPADKPAEDVSEAVRKAVEAATQLFEERVAALEEAIRQITGQKDEEVQGLKAELQKLSDLPGAGRATSVHGEPIVKRAPKMTWDDTVARIERFKHT